MKKFLVLYSGGKAPTNEKEAEASMNRWKGWFEKIGKDLVDVGNPFAASKTVSASGTIDGAGGNVSNGYGIIQAESLDAAARLAKDCPILPEGGKVHVFDLLAM